MIKVSSVNENDDGSCDINIVVDNETLKTLAGYGAQQAFNASVERMKEDLPNLSEEYTYDDDEFKSFVEREEVEIKRDRIIIDELKDALLSSYSMTSTHEEDIKDNVLYRFAAEKMLEYFMTPADYKSFMESINFVYHS
jgi:hypothetical protein